MIHWFNALLLGPALYFSFMVLNQYIKTIHGTATVKNWMIRVLVFLWMLVVALWNKF